MRRSSYQTEKRDTMALELGRSYLRCPVAHRGRWHPMEDLRVGDRLFHDNPHQLRVNASRQ